MKVESIWDKPKSHGEILKKIWKHLDLGTLEREHPFHTPVFGTVASGCTPNLRIVVLRRFGVEILADSLFIRILARQKSKKSKPIRM